MTIKDIIEKLEDMRAEAIDRHNIWLQQGYNDIADCYKYEASGLKEAIIWIKSNLEEGYEKYGKDEDDYFESKIAEEREG